MSHPVQEEDRVATGRIILVAVVSLGLFVIGSIWAVSILNGELESLGPRPPEAAKAVEHPPEVGNVYQWPFYLSHYGNDKAEALHQRLESYGWVDKKTKVVHIPIEQAMERYVASQAEGKK
jgi:hypothetical protein